MRELVALYTEVLRQHLRQQNILSGEIRWNEKIAVNDSAVFTLRLRKAGNKVEELRFRAGMTDSHELIVRELPSVQAAREAIRFARTKKAVKVESIPQIQPQSSPVPLQVILSMPKAANHELERLLQLA